MPGSETHGPDTPETIWKSQEEPTMQSTLTANHLADMSRSRERMSQLIFWTLIAALIACAGSALYHVFTVDQPWLRLGQVWAIGSILYLAAPTLNRGPVRRDANERNWLAVGAVWRGGRVGRKRRQTKVVENVST